MTLDQMGANEWLLVAGALVGPVLAVQAQKWVERLREGKSRREWVFLQLMATRQQRLSLDHVRALNSIDIAFYGSRQLGRLTRRPQFQEVLDAWSVYRSHLSHKSTAVPTTEHDWVSWTASSNELFVNLLEKLAVATGFDFNREELKSGSYLPNIHGRTEDEMEELRQGVLQVLRGERSIPLQVKEMPNNDAALATMMTLQSRMVDALEAIAKIGQPSQPIGTLPSSTESEA